MPKTKLLIMESFREIMGEKDFSKITVNDIVSNIYISRKSFYNHFKDKYDLMEKTIENNILLTRALYKHDYIDCRETTYRLLMNINDNPKLYQNAFSFDEFVNCYTSGIRDNIMIRLKEVCKNKIVRTNKHTMNSIASIIAHSFTGSIVGWLEADMSEVPEILSDFWCSFHNTNNLANLLNNNHNNMKILR